jgi:hypothetical protein
LTGKVHYPPPGDPSSVIIEALEMFPFPGDPTKRAYHESLPNFSHPIVTAVGIVSGAGQTSDTHALTFPLTVEDYVRGGLKTSTVMSVPPQFLRQLATLTIPPLLICQLPCKQSVDEVAERGSTSTPFTVDRDRNMSRNH